MKNVLVLGAGGFIGSHLVESLKAQGHYVIGIDLHEPYYGKSAADSFIVADLRDQWALDNVFTNISIDEVYQLAADMGGAGYINGINLPVDGCRTASL